MTSILGVAMAARLTADEIQNHRFDRCYGTFAKDEDGGEVDPNGGDAVAWCGLGRLCYNLDVPNTTHLLGAVRNSPVCIEALWMVQTGSWPLWDQKRPHAAARHIRMFADKLERYLHQLEAKRREVHA